MSKRSDELLGTLDDISQEHRYLVVDAVACEIFNLGNNLEGNTEESDLEWFARQIWLREDKMRVAGWWDAMIDSQKEEYLGIARACLEALPYLMLRIAHRCQDYAKVLGALEKAERLESQRRRKARR